MGFEQFIAILFSLFVADYLLQPKKMAITKGEPTPKGLYFCIIHCLIYATITSIFLWKFNLVLFIILYLSHFIVDRYSLALYWLDFIKGRNFYNEVSQPSSTPGSLTYELSVPFSCIVYVIVDNGIHLLSTWYLLKLFY